MVAEVRSTVVNARGRRSVPATARTGSFPAPATRSRTGRYLRVGTHGSLLLNNGLKIIGIILVCVLLRKFISRTINKVVRHASQVAEGRAGRMLEGSGLVATERTRQRTQAIGSVLRSVSSTVIFSVGTLMIISVLEI